MTWFLLLFTWFLAVISDQWQTPFCTAYSVSTCASVYWVKEDWHKIATKELFITTEWYWNWLPQLKRFNISYEYKDARITIEVVIKSFLYVKTERLLVNKNILFKLNSLLNKLKYTLSIKTIKENNKRLLFHTPQGLTDKEKHSNNNNRTPITILK